MAAKNELAWKGIYSLISLAGIALIALGYGEARLDSVFLYSTPQWLKHPVYLAMALAMILFFAPYFPGKIKQAAKHPQLVAVKLWATGHLLVNGTLADVILFGAFLIWAVIDRVSMKRRVSRPVPGLKTSAVNDVIVVVLGVIATAAFVHFLHGYLTGVPLLR